MKMYALHTSAPIIMLVEKSDDVNEHLNSYGKNYFA